MEKINSLKNFEKYETRWNEALNIFQHKSVFLTHEWFLNFIKTVYNLNILCVVSDSPDDGQPAIFPGRYGHINIHRLSFNSIEFLSNYYSPYCSVINCENGLSDIIRSLKKEKWDVMLFNDIREHTGEYAYLEKFFSQQGIPYSLYTQDENWYLPCKGIDFQGYLETKGKKKKKKWMYEKQRLEKMPGFKFEMQTANNADLQKAIEAYYLVYSNSWKTNEPFPEFHRSLIETAANRGWLRLGTIWLDQEPIASQIWLIYNNTASILKVAYHEQFKKYSPGRVLTLFIIKHVLENDRVHEIDFLKGGDTYKQEWMTDCRMLKTMLVYNKRSAKGLMLYLFDKFFYQKINSLLAP